MPEYIKIAVWQIAYPVYGYNPNFLRRDNYGYLISFQEYGQTTQHGWEIDHIYPKSRGGSDLVYNLRPLHWKANRMKGDRLPY